jgi:hypothetical protein
LVDGFPLQFLGHVNFSLGDENHAPAFTVASFTTMHCFPLMYPILRLRHQTTTMFCIHPFTNKANFNTFSFGVKQIINAFSGGHFAFIMQF